MIIPIIIPMENVIVSRRLGYAFTLSEDSDLLSQPLNLAGNYSLSDKDWTYVEADLDGDVDDTYLVIMEALLQL